jgi:hypothetical protein
VNLKILRIIIENMMKTKKSRNFHLHTIASPRPLAKKRRR